MFMLISNKPIKVAHLQKLANQPMVNGALGNDNNSFSESNKNLVIWWNEERSDRKKLNKDKGSQKSISTTVRYISKLFQRCKKTGNW